MSGAGVALPDESPATTAETVPVPICPNCNGSRVGIFCADCGERQPSSHDLTVRGMVLEAFQELTSLDGRLVRSMIALVARPGLLTKEWFEGRRGRYVKPLSLFLLLNVAFFIIQPHTQLLSYRYAHYVYGSSAAARHRVALLDARRAKLQLTPAQFETRFNDALQDQKKSLLAFCIPVLALALGVMYLGQGRYLAEHLVFSVHLYAFLLVFMALYVPVFLLGVVGGLRAAGVPAASLAWLDRDSGITATLAAVMGVYVYLALRRVYGDRPLAAALRTVAVFYVVGALVGVYHDVLFYTTLYSL